MINDIIEAVLTALQHYAATGDNAQVKNNLGYYEPVVGLTARKLRRILMADSRISGLIRQMNLVQNTYVEKLHVRTTHTSQIHVYLEKTLKSQD
jgi:hypothetical protein